jgi:hypothetical protein
MFPSFDGFLNKASNNVNDFFLWKMKLDGEVLYFFAKGLIMQPPSIDARRDT